MGWRSFFKHSQKGVPVSGNQINILKNSFFKDPCVYPFTITFASHDAKMDLSTSMGTFSGISPEEPEIAVLERIREEIEGGADADRLLEWRIMLLTCSGQFQKATTKDDAN